LLGGRLRSLRGLLRGRLLRRRSHSRLLSEVCPGAGFNDAEVTPQDVECQEIVNPSLCGASIRDFAAPISSPGDAARERRDMWGPGCAPCAQTRLKWAFARGRGRAGRGAAGPSLA